MTARHRRWHWVIWRVVGPLALGALLFAVWGGG